MRKGHHLRDQERLLGAHMSISGGFEQALRRGAGIGMGTVQIFTKNASQWRARDISKQDVDAFKQERRRTRIQPVIVHDSYLINMASPDRTLYEKSLKAFYEEIKRADRLGCEYLVFHPGAYREGDREAGLKRVSRGLGRILKKISGFQGMLLLETTAGQGTNLGHTFEELRYIIDGIDENEQVGVCFDTCHAFAAGYDFRDRPSYLKTFKAFDRIIGLERLKVFHFNDSKKKLGSRVDRHEHIGGGALGLEPFRLILKDRRFKGVPKILETPKGPDLKKDVENLSVLKSLLVTSA